MLYAHDLCLPNTVLTHSAYAASGGRHGKPQHFIVILRV